MKRGGGREKSRKLEGSRVDPTRLKQDRPHLQDRVGGTGVSVVLVHILPRKKTHDERQNDERVGEGR